MAQYEFGSGILYGRSLDNSPATPTRFGVLQGVTIDFAFSQKELYGQKQFPVALARGTAKITGKADFAQINAQSYNDLFFGQSNPSVGRVVTENGEAGTVTANIVTVTHNGANVFVRDLGVVLASDGTILNRVTNAPVGTGNYSCNETTGVYTFNASAANLAVKVSYQWNDAANGKTIIIQNQDLGSSPQFLAAFNMTYRGKKLNLTLNACMSSKLTFAAKLEDFLIPSFDFSAFSDASDEIGRFSSDE